MKGSTVKHLIVAFLSALCVSAASAETMFVQGVDTTTGNYVQSDSDSDRLIGSAQPINAFSVSSATINTLNVVSILVSGVPISTTAIPEGTNLYFTTARARSSISGGSGITYNSTTGVITASGGGGDITGPASSTNNALALWDGTGGDALKNSTITSANGFDLNTTGTLTAGAGVLGTLLATGLITMEAGAVVEGDIETQRTGTNLNSFSIVNDGDLGMTQLVWGFDGDDSTVTLRPANPSTATHINIGLPSNADGDLVVASVQEANRVFAGPTNGAAAVPSFRALVDADIPSGIARDAELPVGANPTGGVNGTASNGVATTWLRSDVVLALADPMTPADGTQNITGGLTASGALAGSNLSGSSSGANTGDVTLGTNVNNVLGLSGQQITLPTRAANLVFAGPATGVDAQPTFRGLADADIPSTIARDSELPVGANPSAQSGPTAVNGVAATFMTSDSAPAVNQGANYTWTGTHAFNGASTTLGDTTSDQVILNARIHSSMIPGATADLGAIAFRWNNGYLVNLEANGNATIGSDALNTFTVNAGPSSFANATSAADAIQFGTGANLANLYRSANDVLKTDDSLVVVGSITAGGGTFGSAVNADGVILESGSIDLQDITSTGNTTLGNASTDTITANARLSLPNATSAGNSLSIGGDVDLYRSAANTLFTPDAIEIETGSTFGAPGLVLDQNDGDQPFIGFEGTDSGSGAGNIDGNPGSGSATGPFDGIGGWQFFAMVKIRVNGSDVWMPTYTYIEP